MSCNSARARQCGVIIRNSLAWDGILQLKKYIISGLATITQNVG
nr:MAG TPA: hypothetical protein [Caudoviricetes sp.]